MKRVAKLSYTSNPSLQRFIGQVGEISRNEKGGYNFYMPEVGQTISTSVVAPYTSLGDIDNYACKNLGYQTNSGSMYQFDFMDIERLQDGVRKDGNRFVGYEQTYKIGDQVYDSNGDCGVVTHVDYERSLYFISHEPVNRSSDRWYSSAELKPMGLEDKLKNAHSRANEQNSELGGYAKNTKNYEFGY